MVFSDKNNEKFANFICSIVSDRIECDTINYTLDDEFIAVVFSTTENQKTIETKIHEFFYEENLIHVILPYNPNICSISTTKSLFTLIFDEAKKGNDIETDELTLHSLETNTTNSDFIEYKITEKTLDELLDKISKSGINSLTKNEKDLLNKYSKNI